MIKKMLVTAVSGFLVLFFSGIYLLFTEHGTSTLLNSAQKLTQEKLQIESFSGTLGREFSFQNFSYAWATGQVQLGTLAMSWDFWALFRGKIHLNTLFVQDLAIIQRSAKNEQESREKFSLPQVRIPFAFEIDDLEAAKIRFMKDEKNIAEIDRIDMAFEAGMRQMRLNSFHL
ncbi:MAG: hypothetical protein V2I36_02520, partial [Desulfopila sp.]|nr:hypothetical protein [Desulfopila sp.]